MKIYKKKVKMVINCTRKLSTRRYFSFSFNAYISEKFAYNNWNYKNYKRKMVESYKQLYTLQHISTLEIKDWGRGVDL